MVVVIIYLLIFRSPTQAASCSQTDICWGCQADRLPGQARSRLPLLPASGAGAPPAVQGQGGLHGPLTRFDNPPQVPSFSPASSSWVKPQKSTGLAPRLQSAQARGWWAGESLWGEIRHTGRTIVVCMQTGLLTLKKRKLFLCFLWWRLRVHPSFSFSFLFGTGFFAFDKTAPH